MIDFLTLRHLYIFFRLSESYQDLYVYQVKFFRNYSGARQLRAGT